MVSMRNKKNYHQILPLIESSTLLSRPVVSISVSVFNDQGKLTAIVQYKEGSLKVMSLTNFTQVSLFYMLQGKTWP